MAYSFARFQNCFIPIYLNTTYIYLIIDDKYVHVYTLHTTKKTPLA